MIPKTIVAVAALFASLVLLVMGNASLSTIAALRLEIDGFEPGTIGIVLALTSTGFVLGSLYGIRVVQRVGHIRAFAVFASIAAAATLMHPLHVSVPGWMIFRLVLGFCVAGLKLVTESWINSHATNRSRGALLATYMVLFFLAASSGQFIVMLGDPGQHQLFIVAAILFVLSLVPISLTLSTPPAMERADRLSFAALWGRSRLGLTGAAVSGVVLGAFGTVGPVYGYEMGLEIDRIAAFMGISILAAMLIQWPMGIVSDHLPRRLVIVGVAGAAAGLALLTAAFGHRSLLHLYGGVALFYALASCIYPMCLALTHDMLDKRQIVPASATLLLANGIGAVAGPVIGGVAISTLGPGALFVFLAAALGLLLLVAVRSFARERGLDVNDQSHCVGISPDSTPVIMELDPRQDRE